LKFFCELRPGLIGWVLLDLSFIVEALSEQSDLQMTGALALVAAFHTLYVADALWHEVKSVAHHFIFYAIIIIVTHAGRRWLVCVKHSNCSFISMYLLKSTLLKFFVSAETRRNACR
jgi:hypothetical protein